MRADETFVIASGSAVGRAHARAGRSNQDASAVRVSDRGVVAIVADGCGSGAHSELGARLGANVVAELVAREMKESARLDDDALERVRRAALTAIDAAARAMGGDLRALVAEHFLFTLLGVAIDDARAIVFGVGDGLFVIDDTLVELGPFEGNAPPYLAYGLFDEARARFAIHRDVRADEVRALAIATDGASELERRAGEKLAGSEEHVPSLRAIANEARFSSNRDAIRRALFLCARDGSRPIWAERRITREAAVLEDDTTIVVVRREEA